MKQTVDIPHDNPIFGASAKAFEQWQYAPAVRAGGLLFIAGTVGIRSDGTVPGSVAEQTELAFERIAEILRLEGLSVRDLVEVVSYHVGVRDNLEAFLSIKTKFFQHPLPTWTLLGVEALGLPELKIEIKCVAALKERIA